MQVPVNNTQVIQASTCTGQGSRNEKVMKSSMAAGSGMLDELPGFTSVAPLERFP